ncbi:Ig-like domain-containing domain [Chryseobacterium sp. MP_3.2]|uniref:Ig-like domain-containing domain n=1 Tax=Chryseobacterium sp. MP_3.2 TaxID=3071712 RepID=UPI002E034BC1|nr:uncharacterized protein (DUF2141 family) [Chryseobacterium sp. MP_3.2]
MKKLFLLFLFTVLLFSCARVGSPVGGDKDTIPPTVIGSNIDSSRVNVSRNIRELRIDFDEYINLREINKQLIISPPLQKMTKILPSGIPNKFLLIKWEDTLQANKTYNFNFGNAIVDNNEANPLQYYNFAFSTGEKIDDFYISGEVKDFLSSSKNQSEDSKVVVGLYQEKDSMDYRQKPYYITKADPDGYFELNYLSPGDYRIVAFEDSNSNSVYDNGKENVAFQKEKITLDKSISGLNLNLYPSRKPTKYLEMAEVPGGILMTFEGNPGAVKVLSVTDKLQDYKVTQQPKSDSVYVWFDAKKQNLGITGSDNIKLSYDDGFKQDTVSVFYRYNVKNEMSISNTKGNLLAPNKDFIITSNYFVDKIDTQNWTLISDSIRQDFTAEINTDNPFEVRVKSDFKEGKKYSLTVQKESVSSFYEMITKSYRFDFEADKIENYGSLLLTLENPPTQKFWVQFLSESNSVVYSRYGMDNPLTFTSLKPGKYRLRILVDENENGVWDGADFAQGSFAEQVYLFDKLIEVRPLWEIRETWNLTPEIITPSTELVPAQSVGSKTPIQPPSSENK